MRPVVAIRYIYVGSTGSSHAVLYYITAFGSRNVLMIHRAPLDLQLRSIHLYHLCKFEIGYYDVQ